MILTVSLILIFLLIMIYLIVSLYLSHDSFCPMLTNVHEDLTKNQINISKIDLPVLYINMDKSKDRRRSIEDQLDGIQYPLVRIPGVVVSDDDMRKYRKGSKKSVAGCYLAHVNAMLEMLDRNWDKALIIEDDACFRLSEQWPYSLSELDSPSWLSQGTTGYIIDRSTARDFTEWSRDMIDYTSGVDTRMTELYGDNIMNTWKRYDRPGWKCYHYIYPMTIEFKSEIQDQNKKYVKEECRRTLNIIDKLSKLHNQ